MDRLLCLPTEHSIKIRRWKECNEPRSSSYSVSRAVMRASSSSRLRTCISFSSWLCRSRSTVSRMRAWLSANCLLSETMSSCESEETAASVSIASNLLKIWRSCSSFSAKVPCLKEVRRYAPMRDSLNLQHRIWPSSEPSSPACASPCPPPTRPSERPSGR